MDLNVQEIALIGLEKDTLILRLKAAVAQLAEENAQLKAKLEELEPKEAPDKKNK